MIGRPSLLLLTAGAAGLAVVANATTIATGAQDNSANTTRLGNAITQDMNDRDAAAARRKRGLDLREQAAKAASARLAADAEARKKQEETQQQFAGGPNGTPGGAPNPADSQFDELARIYQAMKPKAAAVVFEQLDMEVQMKVASRMRERSTAMIMAAMTPKGAATLSMAMARRGARPQAQPQAQPQVASRAPAAPAATARR